MFNYSILKRNIYSLLYVRSSDYIFRLFSYHLQKYNILGLEYDLPFLNDVEKLNQKRIDLIKKIQKIKPLNNVCISCNGLCCRGNYNHFFSLDYIMRLGSTNPIHAFKLIDKPYSSTFFLAHLKKLITKDNQDVSWMKERALSGERCPEWVEQMGCSLQIDEKPIRCQLYTCLDYRKSFSDEDFNSLALLMRQLLWVTCRTYYLHRQVAWKRFRKRKPSIPSQQHTEGQT